MSELTKSKATEENKKPTIKEQLPQTYVQVETGIYRYKDKDDKITYHERPWIISKKGKPTRTYRSLGFNFTMQSNLGNARTEYHRRRNEVSAGRDPYAAPVVPIAKPTVSAIIQAYIDAGYPDRYLKPRTGRTLECETANCDTLLEYWDGQVWDTLTAPQWDSYAEWRKAEVKAGCTGDRSVDAERITLSNSFRYALRTGTVTSNPTAVFARYQPSSAVKHCREFKPADADDLHMIAAILFEDPRGQALGWQALIEAHTGLRTVEVLMLRMHAKKPGEPGYVDPEGNMHVQRVKHGINPYVHVNEGLREVLQAHAKWHAVAYPKSTWMIPGKLASQPAHKDSLKHALRRISKALNRTLTSHGMRAWYVTIRRSWGVDDAVIAIELGQKSGAGLIATTYGDIPSNWRNGGGPKMQWLPSKVEPAWAELEKNGWKFPKHPGKVDA